MELLIKLGIFLFLALLGFVVGTIREKAHYRSIRAREQLHVALPAMNFGKDLGQTDDVLDSRLVMGSAVISIDFFKRFLASLINLFGGRVTPYETLVDRARREAILRLKEDAIGMDAVINLRIETSTIGTTNKDKGMGSIEVLAYGTALKFQA